MSNLGICHKFHFERQIPPIRTRGVVGIKKGNAERRLISARRNSALFNLNNLQLSDNLRPHPPYNLSPVFTVSVVIWLSGQRPTRIGESGSRMSNKIISSNKNIFKIAWNWAQLRVFGKVIVLDCPHILSLSAYVNATVWSLVPFMSSLVCFSYRRRLYPVIANCHPICLHHHPLEPWLLADTLMRSTGFVHHVYSTCKIFLRS